MIKRIKVHTEQALNEASYRFPGNYGVEKFLELFSGIQQISFIFSRLKALSCSCYCYFTTFHWFSPSLCRLQRKITTPSVWRTCSRIATLKAVHWVWLGRVIWKTLAASAKRMAIIVAVWKVWIRALWRCWIMENMSHPPSLTSRWLTKSDTISDRQYVWSY